MFTFLRLFFSSKLKIQKQIERQANIIINYQHEIAALKVKTHDLKTIIYLSVIAKGL